MLVRHLNHNTGLDDLGRCWEPPLGHSLSDELGEPHHLHLLQLDLAVKVALGKGLHRLPGILMDQASRGVMLNLVTIHLIEGSKLQSKKMNVCTLNEFIVATYTVSLCPTPASMTSMLMPQVA